MRVANRVEQILRSSQVYRDSDKRLLLEYWQQQGLHLTQDQRDVFLKSCTTAESITRARRLLRADYPATSAVDDARYDKFIDYKNNHAVSWINEGE